MNGYLAMGHVMANRWSGFDQATYHLSKQDDTMRIGTPYYPEHWPRERWETDARLMREAGISRIRLAEFAWYRMEPTDGVYDFVWLREAIDLFGRYGIDTILCTPTPTYPAWLHRKCPDLHQVKSNGLVKEFGQRQDACKNHPGYRTHAQRIVTRMLEELGDHPHVIAWQTDNEFGCHDTARCYCRHCEREFQSWLSQRFAGDIAALNQAWGTFFWSQDYNDFSEVSLPRDTADCTGNDGQNPSLVLDFYRFSSDVQIRFHSEQCETIHAASPGRPITHNLMGLFSHIDYFKLAEYLDVVSWDNYPFGMNGTNQPPPPLAHDLMRGLKQQNVWVMEQASGPGGWGSFAATPQPGQMRLWAYQAVARGAEFISFFRWRTCRFGREQYWHGILYHHGEPQRRYDELKALGVEADILLPELKPTTVDANVAILYDYDSLWALEIQPNAQDFGYADLAQRWDMALAQCGVSADVLPLDADLSPYRMVIAPCLHLCSAATASRLESYVCQGGHLLVGPRSGVKDDENAVVNDMLPGVLRELAGCIVEEYDAFSNGPDIGLTVSASQVNRPLAAKGIADVLVPDEDAETVLRYDSHYYAGKAAAVRHRIGSGSCTYVGTTFSAQDTALLLQSWGSDLGLGALTMLPNGVEKTIRRHGEHTVVFLLNHTDQDITVKDECQGIDLLSRKMVHGTVELPPFGVAVIKQSAT